MAAARSASASSSTSQRRRGGKKGGGRGVQRQKKGRKSRANVAIDSDGEEYDGQPVDPYYDGDDPYAVEDLDLDGADF